MCRRLAAAAVRFKACRRRPVTPLVIYYTVISEPDPLNVQTIGSSGSSAVQSLSSSTSDTLSYILHCYFRTRPAQCADDWQQQQCGSKPAIADQRHPEPVLSKCYILHCCFRTILSSMMSKYILLLFQNQTRSMFRRLAAAAVRFKACRRRRASSSASGARSAGTGRRASTTARPAATAARASSAAACARTTSTPAASTATASSTRTSATSAATVASRSASGQG